MQKYSMRVTQKLYSPINFSIIKGNFEGLHLVWGYYIWNAKPTADESPTGIWIMKGLLLLMEYKRNSCEVCPPSRCKAASIHFRVLKRSPVYRTEDGVILTVHEDLLCNMQSIPPANLSTNRDLFSWTIHMISESPCIKPPAILKTLRTWAWSYIYKCRT